MAVSSHGKKSSFRGVGEVRAYRENQQKAIIAAIEPFHGNELVTYSSPSSADEEPKE